MIIHFFAQIAKLKLDFDGVKRQNDSLQQLLRERRGTTTIIPQKRRRNPEDDDDDYADDDYADDDYADDDDDDDNDRPPRSRRGGAEPSGVSRERIHYVLGGCDRGWGSTQ